MYRIGGLSRPSEYVNSYGYYEKETWTEEERWGTTTYSSYAYYLKDKDIIEKLQYLTDLCRSCSEDFCLYCDKPYYACSDAIKNIERAARDGLSRSEINKIFNNCKKFISKKYYCCVWAYDSAIDGTRIVEQDGFDSYKKCLEYLKEKENCLHDWNNEMTDSSIYECDFINQEMRQLK